MSRNLFLLLMLLGTSMFAQQKSSGIIYYSQVIDTKASGGGQVSISGGGNFSMPDKITNKFELVFNANGAKLQRSTVDEQLGDGGTRVVMRMGSAARTVYFNFADSKVTESFDLNGEEFIMDSKLGGLSGEAVKSAETKEIIGFTCQKASFRDKMGNETTFWYTLELPIKASPMPGVWTDGVVLGIENNRMKYYATSIEYLKVKDSEFALPKKAKPITEEEYKKKMDEMRSRMQQGGGAFRIGG